MANAARVEVISYGSYSVGGANTKRKVDAYHSFEDGFITIAVEFSYIIKGDNQADFETELAAAEDIWRTPYQNFTVDFGAGPILSLSHSGNTGFNSQPRVIKRENLQDTLNSRRYTIRIDFGRPANKNSLDGRRTSSVDVRFTPSRRRIVTITATWTAVPGTGARDQYNAAIGAYVTSVLTALGGESLYELTEEPRTEADDQDKVIEITRVYEEVIFSQGGASNDDPAIVRQVFRVRRQRVAPGDTPEVNRLVTLVATWDAWIDKDVTTNLISKYNSIRPFIIQQVANTLQGGVLALIDESVEPDFGENRITATLTFEGSQVGGFLEQEVTIEDFRVFGLVLIPAWTGNPLSKYDYQGPETRRRTITEVFTHFGDFAADPFTDTPPGTFGKPLTSRVNSKRKRKGIDGIQFDVTEITRVTEREFFISVGLGAGQTQVAAGAGGGPGGVNNPNQPGVAGGPGTGSGGLLALGIGSTGAITGGFGVGAGGGGGGGINSPNFPGQSGDE